MHTDFVAAPVARPDNAVSDGAEQASRCPARLHTEGTLKGDALSMLMGTPVPRLPREECIRMDAPYEGLFRLDEGACLGYRILRDGRRQIVAIHLPGDVINPDCLVCGVSRQAVVPATFSRLAFAPLGALKAAAGNDPAIGWLLARETARQLAIFEARICSLGRRTALERIAFLLCEIYWRSAMRGLAANDRCALPLTQNDISDALGMSVVHANRVLKVLRQRGFAALEGGRLHIGDWDRLARFADFDGGYLLG
ncbi:MAG TPA: helix-turn-helix domain-containing protein [Pararhizobium sp.]|nr:helix-turn-helix domain-containing protein [Pararhizobium sp.]